MRVLLAAWLALFVLAGCANAPHEARGPSETKAKQRLILETDRYIAKEFNHRRPYIHRDQTENDNIDLDHRVANEAERVYNVYRAVVLRQGRDIIIGLKTKPDPWQPHYETVERARDRLLKKERSLQNYNLYFTNDDRLIDQMIRARVQAEGSDQKDSNQTYEPHFSRILNAIQKSNR